MRLFFALGSVALLFSACAGTKAGGAVPSAVGPTASSESSTVGVARIRSDALKMSSFVSTDLSREFLRASKDLPEVAPRTLYRDRAAGQWFSARDQTAIEGAGFEVIAFDRDDTGPIRAMAKILACDVGEEKVDLEKDLFATYTLLRKTPPR